MPRGRTVRADEAIVVQRLCEARLRLGEAGAKRPEVLGAGEDDVAVMAPAHALVAGDAGQDRRQPMIPLEVEISQRPDGAKET